MAGADPERLQRLRDETAAVATSAERMAAALAAVGAILLGGLQVADLGTLRDPERIVVAAVGGAAAVIGMTSAVMVILRSMLPGVASLSNLCHREQARGQGDPLVAWIHANSGTLLRGEDDTVSELTEAYHDALDELRSSYDAQFESVSSPKEADERRRRMFGARQWATYVNGVIAELLAAVKLEQARRAFARGKRVVAAFSVVTAAGVLALIWATNPPEEPTLDLRGADLTGAQLRGLELRGANLSGMTIRGADLRDTYLGDADIEDTKWESTVCPDGVGSHNAGATCSGHLKP